MRTSLRSVWLLLFVVGRALPQSADTGSSADTLKVGSVTFSGSVRERVEFWDWFAGRGQNQYAFSGTLAQFALSQNSPGFEWKIDMAVPILLGLPHNAVVAAPQGQLGIGGNYFANNRSNRYAIMAFPKQAYVRLKREHTSAQIGRFEFADGSEVTPADATLAVLKRDRIAQRLIGTFGYTDIQRSFDGINAAY